MEEIKHHLDKYYYEYHKMMNCISMEVDDFVIGFLKLPVYDIEDYFEFITNQTENKFNERD